MNSPASATRVMGCLLAVMLLVLISSSVASGMPAAASDRPPGLEGAVDDLINEQMASGTIPGVAVTITKGKDVLYLRGYGHDSAGAPISPHTPFRIASLSKSFTALAVMQLVEAGKVRLDEPVKSYLHEFVTSDQRSTGITVRQLLNQTSGLADSGFPELSRPQPTSLKGAVERLRSAALVADPGTEWNYHNPNYHLAARLVEVVAGEPFDEYLEQHVFHPLGMEHTVATANDKQDVPGLAEGYSLVYGRPVAVPGPGFFVTGSGGVVSTASDMARWLIIQNNDGEGGNGARVVSAQSVRQMHAPSAPGGYGLGWDTDGPRNHPTRITHGGAEFTFSSYQALLPDSGYGIAVLFNSTTPLWIEQTNIVEGLISIASGDRSPAAPVSSVIIDEILAAVTLAILALGVLAVVRSGRWGDRRMKYPAWRVGLGLLPHTGAIALCLAFPNLAGFLFGGREVTWLTAAYGWPALLVLLGLVALVEGVTIAARVGQFLRRTRQPRGGSRVAGVTSR